MSIGEKIRQLRMVNGLTQEELADRAELSKGFISQVERDLTSPSIATLIDILQCLGTDLKEFFGDSQDDKMVFKEEDTFEKDYADEGYTIRWLIPDCQKNAMEPILVTIQPGSSMYEHQPHEGEEFAYVLSGSVTLIYGSRRLHVRKGESFSIRSKAPHRVINEGKKAARLLWVASPPSF